MSYLKKILVATHKNIDPFFKRSVVFIFNETDGLVDGIILNKPEKEVQLTNFKFDDSDKVSQEIIDHIPDASLGYMYNGGPLERESVYFIHSYKEYLKTNHITPGKEENHWEYDKYEAENDINIVMEDIYFGSPNTCARIVADGKFDKKFKFFSGVSVWEQEQLAKEIENGFWIVKDYTSGLFYDDAAINLLSFNPSWN